MLITGFRYLRLVLCKYTYLYSSHRLYQTVQQGSPAGRSRPSILGANVRVLRWDRLSGMIREYSQVA